MNVPLWIANDVFHVRCTLRGARDREIMAVVDSGASVTAVRRELCLAADLEYAGTYQVTCVHGEHAGVEMAMYNAELVIGGRPGRVLVYELGRVVAADGSIVYAILGRNVLRNWRVTLDWLRLSGSLQA